MADITLKQLQEFHNIDRHAYARLVLGLGFRPSVSMKIVAFWNFLETTAGFRHFVNTLQQLPDALLSSLAKEALICLDALYSSSSGQQNFSWVNMDFPVMRKLVGQEISFAYLFGDRESAKTMIRDFVEDVCQVAFFDIVVTCLASKQSSKPNNGVETVDSGDRTLFMTFSRGYPVSDQELRGFILRKFGKCVEAIYMDQNPQPLFACVVLNTLSDMSRILGGKKLVKFSINGKQARARRYVPRSAMQSQKLPSFC